ncbi:MAG: hypothetical protein IPM24_04725 [Bryobacterales bacterium]|nr:hypothetical protein [Bryobacterales bacterium]
MTLTRLLLPLIACFAAAAAERIEAFGFTWRVPVMADWQVLNEGAESVLKLNVPRPFTEPRRPIQYALAETADFERVTIEAEVRKEPFDARQRRTSLIFVYAWRDETHFNYAHLSVDSGEQVAVHNGIFHVYGGERVRISPLTGPGTLAEGRWHKVRLEYDSTKGLVEVFVDGKTSPALRAVDLSLGAGKVGIGSFFDMGEFRRVRITGR